MIKLTQFYFGNLPQQSAAYLDGVGPGGISRRDTMESKFSVAGNMYAEKSLLTVKQIYMQADVRVEIQWLTLVLRLWCVSNVSTGRVP